MYVIDCYTFSFFFRSLADNRIDNLPASVFQNLSVQKYMYVTITWKSTDSINVIYFNYEFCFQLFDLFIFLSDVLEKVSNMLSELFF